MILDEDFMSAVNMTGDSYRVGLCTTLSAAASTAIMKIPIQSKGTLTFHMLVNTAERVLNIDLATGLTEQADALMEIYPNPVTDRLNISGLKGPVRAGIYSIQGQLLSSMVTEGFVREIDVSDLLP